jgi:23S rRNA pseudouridine1911/1915/1917 synthase
VRIDGNAARKGAQKLHGGETITVEIAERPPLRAEAEAIPLDILYEDEDVVAVNKAAGMTVHAGAGTTKGAARAGTSFVANRRCVASWNRAPPG